MPQASVNANLVMHILINAFSIQGFIEKAANSAPKTIPIPVPALQD